MAHFGHCRCDALDGGTCDHCIKELVKKAISKTKTKENKMAGKFGQKATAGTTAAPATKTVAAPATTKSEPKNVQLFDIRTVDTKNGPKTKIQLSKGVQITYNGVAVDAGEYNSFFLKDNEEHENDLAFLVDNKYMTEEVANQDVAFIQDKGITLRLKVPNPKLQS